MTGVFAATSLAAAFSTSAASGRERISVKRWEALADGVLDAAVAAFLEAKRSDGERF